MKNCSARIDCELWNISWNLKTTPYLTHTDPVYSPSVQPLSETGCFSSCLFKAHSVLIGQSLEATVHRQTMQQTTIVGFHYFFSFFTRHARYLYICLCWNLMWNMRADNANSTCKTTNYYYYYELLQLTKHSEQIEALAFDLQGEFLHTLNLIWHHSSI